MKKLVTIGTIFLYISLCCFLETHGQHKNFHLFNEQTPHVKLLSTKVAIIEGTLNGKKACFLIDTGSTISVLNHSKKNHYNFKKAKILGQSVTLSGIGGEHKALYSIYNAEIMIGEILIVGIHLSTPLDEINRNLFHKTGYNIAGVLGSNTIELYGFVIDYANKICWLGVGIDLND